MLQNTIQQKHGPFFKVFGIMGINFVFMIGLVVYLSRYMIESKEDTEEIEASTKTEKLEE